MAFYGISVQRLAMHLGENPENPQDTRYVHQVIVCGCVCVHVFSCSLCVLTLLPGARLVGVNWHAALCSSLRICMRSCAFVHPLPPYRVRARRIAAHTRHALTKHRHMRPHANMQPLRFARVCAHYPRTPDTHRGCGVRIRRLRCSIRLKCAMPLPTTRQLCRVSARAHQAATSISDSCMGRICAGGGRRGGG